MYLGLSDWLVIAIYAMAIAVIGFVLVRKSGTAEGYFLAGRTLTWPVIGASLFAANISAEHFVGLAGLGYKDGMIVGAFEWMAVFCLVPLILLFLPFYIRNKIFTVPEFLEQRFSRGVRMFFSAFMVVLSVLAKVSISLWASALVFEQLLGWDRHAVIWGVGVFTALYTMKGGLRVVVYTDALQTVILIVAAVVLTASGLQQVGGWHGLQDKLAPEMFQMVKPATHPDYPWFGMFIGVFILGSFYWSMDQVLVQRAFAARSLDEGRLGAIFCGFLKLLTPFLLVLPGLIAKVLYPSLEKPDHAYPTLLSDPLLMPHGLLGLTVAGITAALMGHISATYNSIATLITRDFYLHWRPEASQDRQVFVGRVAVVCVFVLGALWAPMIGKFGSLWIYLQTVQAYLMMPFAGIFFAGVLWKRTTTRGVIACLITASIVCPLLMFNGQLIANQQAAEQRAADQPTAGQPTAEKAAADGDSAIHLRPFLPFMGHPLLRPWLHAAFAGFLVCMVVLVAVSLTTSPVSAEKLRTTTVSNWRDLLVTGGVAPYRNYLFWLGLLLVICSGLWYVMR